MKKTERTCQGGEKKKIAIARVLYSNADVIILDEVTSNIDKDSAEEILSRIFEKKDKIIFVISHDGLPADYANKRLRLTAEAL